jgi:hypothetical protein
MRLFGADGGECLVIGCLQPASQMDRDPLPNPWAALRLGIELASFLGSLARQDGSARPSCTRVSGARRCRDDAGLKLRKHRMRTTNLIRVLLPVLLLICALALPALAQETTDAPPAVATETAPAVAEVPAIDAGNTAWMITATALVLLLTFAVL